MKHTKGPWITNVWTTGRRTVGAENNLVIAEIHQVHKPDEMKANARLIASAPELLEALKRCANHLRNRPDPTPGDELLYTEIRPIVLKATGGE